MVSTLHLSNKNVRFYCAFCHKQALKNFRQHFLKYKQDEGHNFRQFGQEIETIFGLFYIV